MFGLFKKKAKAQIAPIKSVPFKSNDAAFEYAAKYCPSELRADSLQIIGQISRVLSPSEGNGLFNMAVKLATTNGIIETKQVGLAMDGYYGKVGKPLPKLEVGDLVLVGVGLYLEELDINHLGQSFFVIAKILPEMKSDGNLVLDGEKIQ